jgi:hypothetical protein
MTIQGRSNYSAAVAILLLLATAGAPAANAFVPRVLQRAPQSFPIETGTRSEQDSNVVSASNFALDATTVTEDKKTRTQRIMEKTPLEGQ